MTPRHSEGNQRREPSSRCGDACTNSGDLFPPSLLNARELSVNKCSLADYAQSSSEAASKMYHATKGPSVGYGAAYGVVGTYGQTRISEEMWGNTGVNGGLQDPTSPPNLNPLWHTCSRHSEAGASWVAQHSLPRASYVVSFLS